MDEGLAGKQRQFEGWIHNLNKELNHYKAANAELSNKLRELCGSASQPKEHAKGKCIIRSHWLVLLICLIMVIVGFIARSERAKCKYPSTHPQANLVCRVSVLCAIESQN